MANVIITPAQADKLERMLKGYSAETISDNWGTLDGQWDPLLPEWEGTSLNTLNRALYQPYDIASFSLAEWVVRLEDNVTLEVLQDNIQEINESYAKYRATTLEEEREGKRRKQFRELGRNVDEYKRDDIIRIHDDAYPYVYRIVRDVYPDSILVDSERVAETSIGEKVYFDNIFIVCAAENRMDMDIK
jgi:hypothetical protein